MLKPVFIVGLGLFSLLYLINPGAGVFELIPDNIPIIGNIDEAAAVVLLLSCLRYFGIDIADLFSRKQKTNPKRLDE